MFANLHHLIKVFEPYVDYDNKETLELPVYKKTLFSDASEEAKKAFKEYVKIYEDWEKDGLL